MPSLHLYKAPVRSLLVLAAALTACGDDGSGDDATTNLPTLPATVATGSAPGTTQDLPTGDTSNEGTEGMAGSTGGEPPTTDTTGIGETATGSSGAEDTTAGVVSTGGEESSSGSTGAPIDVCKVNDDMDAVVPCTDEAPPNSFEPDVQWAWPGQDGENEIAVTPAVANLTDDNGDGEIDLCDIPDIVVPAYTGSYWTGSLYVFDGATGAVHFKVANAAALTYPAIADIDNDGLPEILTGRSLSDGPEGYLMALEHDGTLKWTSQVAYQIGSAAIAVADIDHDGDVEIVHHGSVFDHNGALLWQAQNTMGSYVNTIADLDGDDNMEVILGPTAYRHDGSMYYSVGIGDGHPQVADLDMDGQPEVLVVTQSGLSLIEHDGTLTYSNQQANLARWQPASIHDFDGDLQPEFAVSSGSNYSVFETNLQPKWTVNIQDGSGYASSTAFDFLGDGTAEAMYADEVSLFIFDNSGQPLLMAPRGSWTQWENPIVVDVDNDASAEIVVVSNSYGNTGAPPLQVIRDKMDRWIPARRIWNQHTYHVTNVREDATIPQLEPKSWTKFNTFRTQAQIANGGVCLPEPQ